MKFTGHKLYLENVYIDMYRVINNNIYFACIIFQYKFVSVICLNVLLVVIDWLLSLLVKINEIKLSGNYCIIFYEIFFLNKNMRWSETNLQILKLIWPFSGTRINTFVYYCIHCNNSNRKYFISFSNICFHSLECEFNHFSCKFRYLFST